MEIEFLLRELDSRKISFHLHKRHQEKDGDRDKWRYAFLMIAASILTLEKRENDLLSYESWRFSE